VAQGVNGYFFNAVSGANNPDFEFFASAELAWLAT